MPEDRDQQRSREGGQERVLGPDDLLVEGQPAEVLALVAAAVRSEKDPWFPPTARMVSGATVETPSVVVGGVTLEGVRIRLEEDDAEAEGQASEDSASEETP